MSGRLTWPTPVVIRLKFACFPITLFIKKLNFLSVLISVGVNFLHGGWYALCFGFVLNTELTIWRYFCYCCRQLTQGFAVSAASFVRTLAMLARKLGPHGRRHSCDTWPKLTRRTFRPYVIMLSILCGGKKEEWVSFGVMVCVSTSHHNA